MDAVSRLLLRRGARTDLKPTADSPSIADAAREAGNHRIADLLRAPLGGRHCRIHSLNGRPELNGSTGVAVAYSAARERYTIEVDGVENAAAWASGEGGRLTRQGLALFDDSQYAR